MRDYITKRLEVAGKKRDRINAATAPPPPQASAKQLSFEWVRRPEKRKPAEQVRLDAIRAREATSSRRRWIWPMSLLL